jgi:hypothetical protein
MSSSGLSRSFALPPAKLAGFHTEELCAPCATGRKTQVSG